MHEKNVPVPEKVLGTAKGSCSGNAPSVLASYLALKKHQIRSEMTWKHLSRSLHDKKTLRSFNPVWSGSHSIRSSFPSIDITDPSTASLVVKQSESDICLQRCVSVKHSTAVHFTLQCAAFITRLHSSQSEPSNSEDTPLSRYTGEDISCAGTNSLLLNPWQTANHSSAVRVRECSFSPSGDSKVCECCFVPPLKSHVSFQRASLLLYAPKKSIILSPHRKLCNYLPN